MSNRTHDPEQDPDDGPSGRDEDRYIPSADQDVASGQPYDPRQDPDTDPDMLQEKAPPEAGVNRRDPAEGADDESATDG
ncbi:hypothetical protein [Ornithinimicrobium murale]|uniref:hypothetical protein n=1 Tax=Ornithinimicrobium murale TaxID=1050153 RepID=UPI000E0DB2F1|nr:hypothetical protein [Ornithinimicrobium murale]